MPIQLILELWVLMFFAAIGAAALAERRVVPVRGQYAAHIFKSLVMAHVALIVSFFYGWMTQGEGWVLAALGAGAVWVCLTVTFEFIFGRFVVGEPWDILLADYKIWEGRLWPLVLAAEATGPLLMGVIFNL